LEFQQSHDVEKGFQKAPTPAEVPSRCGKCHSDEAYMRRFTDGPWVDYVDRFLQSVHGRHLLETGGERAATCTSCHKVHNMRRAEDPQSPVHPAQLAMTCGRCHEQQLIDLRRGVHETAGQADSRGVRTLLGCLDCHQGDVHAMVPVKDASSPVVQANQVRSCGSCHPKDLATFQLGPHAAGPQGSEVAVAAACADCHGSHAVYRAADRRSLLHSTQVGETCGRCHEGIGGQVADSIHGVASVAAPGAEPHGREPRCVDCHRGHDQVDSDSPLAQLQRTSRCGNCHADLAQTHRLQTHSRLTETGYVPAAGCAECHGAHDVLSATHSDSRLGSSNRVTTCRSCHPGAVANFADFDPHASYKDAHRNPLLYDAHETIGWFIFGVFGLFVAHSGLWFTRSFFPTLAHGRHKRLAEHQRAVVRFGPVVRAFYVVLLVCFIGLLVTALPMTYSDQAWAVRLAGFLGGFVLARAWHILFAVVVLLVSAAHVVHGMWRIRDARKRGLAWKKIFFGPDSPVPNRRDVRDFVGMVRWFFGRGEKPTFERWAYWEKLDYWAFAATVVVIGLSGLMLWLPGVFSLVLPGSMLNLAKMVHSEVALLAAGLVFVIHLFNMHLRPEKFPIDTSVFTGLVSEQHMRAARPDFLRRMEEEGRLDIVERLAPSERYLRFVGWAGVAALTAALLLLAWIFFVSLGK
jgi:cytochrome b subunit of formate dehydrogenase/nitrate/TMAO reductase-like tetraheme cytochrome c subunit